MSQINDYNSNNEFNNFLVEEIITSKEKSYETGEYNEIQIENELIVKVSEEESSSSEEESSTSKVVSLGSTIGMVVGVGGIVIGTITSVTTSLLFLNTQSIIGISQAQCLFQLSNANYQELNIHLEDENGNLLQYADLLPTDFDNQYVAEFYDLSPSSTYYLKGIDDNGKEVSLGENNYFTTLDIPNYDISVDTSNYNKTLNQYDLTFTIDNPNNYHIDGLLICENDETLNQHLLKTDGVYNFTLPNILSSYRLELYQEDYLVGQTTFTDYEKMSIIDETLEIGISSFDAGLNFGEINLENIDISIITSDGNNVNGVEYGPDGYILYVRCYGLTPNTDYILKISDINRETFTYFSYPFKTISVPNFTINIDDSNFDIASGIYDLTFTIDNPNGYFIYAYLTCLNDETLNDYYYFEEDNSLNITLPTPYSMYRLDLKLEEYGEEYDVGSINFSYYKPMSVNLDTLVIDSTSFETQVDLGDVPLENISAFIYPNDIIGDELELEIRPSDIGSSIYLRMDQLLNNTSYVLEIRDNQRPTLVYLSYQFTTLA